MRIRRAPLETLSVGGLQFAVRWSQRRRTIGITVARDGGLRVLAPTGVPARKLEAAVRAKLPWVRRKRAEMEALGPPPTPKRFTAGERLPYLGREYELALVDAHTAAAGPRESAPSEARRAAPAAPAAPFALRRGRFELARGLDGEARATVLSWYLAHARVRVDHRVAHFAPLVGAAPAAVVVRDLGRRRWGTCHSHTRTVTFHWELILQPPEILDYVVVHELTHLHAPDHGPGFWRRVESVLPDWKRRRAWLSGHGQRHVV